MKLLQIGHGFGRQNLTNSLISPSRTFTTTNIGDLEPFKVGRFGKEMTQIRQTDPGEFQVLEIDKRDRISVQKRHVLSVNIEDVIGGLLNVQGFKIGTRIDQPRKNEVVGGNELEGVDVLSHIGDISRLLRKRNVELASYTIGEGDLFSPLKDVFEVGHHLIDRHLDLVFVFNPDRFYMIKSNIFQTCPITGFVLHHRGTITTIIDLVENTSAKSKVSQTCQLLQMYQGDLGQHAS